MSDTFLLSHSLETGRRQLWTLNQHDHTLRPLAEVDGAQALAALGDHYRDYRCTAVGSYLLLYKPLSSVDPHGQADVEFTLFRLEQAGSALRLALVQQGRWPWYKFTEGYSDSNDPGGRQITALQLQGVTGYVMSRLATQGRSSFGLWNFDACNDAPGGSKDPIEQAVAHPDAFLRIADDDVLIPILNHVLVLNHAARTWRCFSFDPQLPHPLSYPVLASGTLPAHLPDTVIALGDQLLAWTPGAAGHASGQIYAFSPTAPFSQPKKAKFPAAFASDRSTTLTALHPRLPLRPEQAQTPGTIDFMRSRIKHVVAYVLESRSFDSVLGWLHERENEVAINWVGAPADARFEGASRDHYNTDFHGTRYHQFIYQDGAVGTGFKLDSPAVDPYHRVPDSIRQQWQRGYAAYAGGEAADMGGFVRNSGLAQVMATYAPAQLGVLSGLAKSYAVSDRWFCSEAGGTTTNRATLVSGSAYNMTVDYEGGTAYQSFADIPHRQSLWKVLANNGVMDWAIYYSVLWENHPYTYHLALEGQLPSVDQYAGQYVQPIASFLDAAKNGTLPAFSFLEPVWIDPAGLFTSYHPAGNVLPGEQALQNIFEALSSGPNWHETVLVVSFSKGGGLYDHVPAEPMRKAWPNDGVDGYEFNTTGTRVPTLIISPLVEPNTVFRSDTGTPYDATSLAATVLSWLGIPRSRWGMGERIAAAPTFEAVLQRSSPRTDLPTLVRAIDQTYTTPAPIPLAPPSPVASTWAATAASSSWTDPRSWSDAKLPSSVATFAANTKTNTSTTVTFALAAPQTVNEVVFDAAAPAYTLLFDDSAPALPTLSIAGAGVVNHSVHTQTFDVQASSVSPSQVQLAFLNQASAGRSNVLYQVGPATPQAQSGGIIAFNQRSSAGSAHFKVSVGARPPSGYATVGGEVRFLHHSSAAKAHFRVSGTTGPDSDTFGSVVFHNHATAAAATFTNVGGTVGDGGNTQFYEQTTADHATIVNEGASGAAGNGGDTAFDGTASAADASITNQAARQGNGGVTSFNNNSPYMAADCGATAGRARIANLGAETGQAGTGGHTEFTGIYGAGNAGQATIDNYGSATATPHSGGHTLFAVNGQWPYARPSAAQATITNHPGHAKGTVAGSTLFTYQDWNKGRARGDDSLPGPRAGRALIVNKGASVAGAPGGTTTFDYHATAERATLVAEAGGHGGGPGVIRFRGYATGAGATVVLAGGTLDLSRSRHERLTLGTLTVSAGGTIACEVGDRTPILQLLDSLTLSDAPLHFAFRHSRGSSLPAWPIVLLEAAALADMIAQQFSGTITGADCVFTIDPAATPPQLKVSFRPHAPAGQDAVVVIAEETVVVTTAA